MKTLWTVLLSTFALVIFSQINLTVPQRTLPERSEVPGELYWVDSVFNALTPEERIAQLFMVPAYSNKSMEDNRKITELVSKYNIGGIIFFQGGPITQARMTNTWQSLAKTPLLVAIDGEWGLGMRLKDSTLSFPRQMTLGAIQDDSLIYAMGCDIARQCKRLGLQVNFAPVVDVNSNPRNPVINYRSFGELRENVARKGIAYMRGLQDNQVMASAKHFPGHGDTDQDSHLTLPTINHDLALLDSLDLYPFRALIQEGLYSVMVAHLFVPAIDPEKNPTTLSYKVINGLLREKLGFKGLVFTDALGMEGVKASCKPGQIEIRALQAGDDMLLMSDDVPLAIDSIKAAIKDGRLWQADIDQKCRKVLSYKYKTGLYAKPQVALKGLYEDLNSSSSKWLIDRLFEASVTLLKNENELIPVKNLEQQRIACISVSKAGEMTPFQKMCGLYADMSFFNIREDSVDADYLKIKDTLRLYNLVIAGLHSSSSLPDKNYGISAPMIKMVTEIAAEKKVILDLFANPYAVASLGDPAKFAALLVSYQNHEYAQQAGAEAIFGGIPVMGKLPVTASGDFPVNTGLQTNKIRLKYTFPEEVGIRSLAMNKIDSLVQKGLKDSVYPGCQLFVAVKGNVIYHKSFGNQRYDPRQPVQLTDLYDLASVTKVAATTISVMKLYEEGKIHLDDSLPQYLPELKNSNKAHLRLRQVLTHQAGLKPFIPFYRDLVKSGVRDTNVFRKTASAEFPWRVADSIYIRYDYPDSLYKIIIRSELREKMDYRYSDLGFYLMKRIVENLTQESLSRYAAENFYSPLGLSTMCYLPRTRFPLTRIVPSEKDTSFRFQEIWGDVNDPGAAMCGGIQGHAGLFSDASDLGTLFQMLIQGGEYGGRRYFSPATITEFTRYQYKDNRRGLGFDKPVRDRDGGPSCKEASDESFGHSGFTGTYVWADPTRELVYVFLSNRTYPYSANNKLVESGIRTKIQEVIYQALDQAR